MGSVIPLKKTVNSSYLELKNLVDHKLIKVEEVIQKRLVSKVSLIKKMTDHHLSSGGKRIRALLTLGSSKLLGYELGNRDVNLSTGLREIEKLSNKNISEEVIEKLLDIIN